MYLFYVPVLRIKRTPNMHLKKILPLMFFTIFIQNSSQQAHAITEQQVTIASYIVGTGAGTASGALVLFTRTK